MEGWFLDCWRSGETIACWVKTQDADTLVHVPFSMTVYAKPYPNLIGWLERNGIAYAHATRCEYDGAKHRLIAISAPVERFEQFVDRLEAAGRYRTPLFDADIGPEQRFMIEHDLYAGCPIRFTERSIEHATGDPLAALRVRTYAFSFDTPLRGRPSRVRSINGSIVAFSDEGSMLEALARDLETHDPDVLVIDHAHAVLPIVDARMRVHRLTPRFHRFDAKPIKVREGRSLFRYGSVVWRDAAVSLRGRIVLDQRSDLGEEDVEGLIELSKLSGARLQTIASRSPGSVFQHAVVRDILRTGQVVSHKRKPLSAPMSMNDLVRSDRAGLSFDPIIGFHTNVVELDYEAMFPNLMVAKNISAEKIGSGSYAPDVPVRVDQNGESIVSRAMRPFVDLRAHYKYGNERERARAKALKGVLVSANGYLRFREFKLGIPTSHVALCAWAREYLLRAKELAEDDGYRIVHGIVDSIYLSGDVDEARIDRLRTRIEEDTGLRIAHEGTFRWIVFLASKTNERRPVITRFFGVFTDGSVKLRGIEARQKSTPRIVSMIQHALVEYLGRFDSYDRVRDAIPTIAGDLTRIASRIATIDRELLACSVTISKDRYATNSIAYRAREATIRAGIEPAPGQRIRYVHTIHGMRTIDDPATIDPGPYRTLITSAIATVTDPFGYDAPTVSRWVHADAQRSLRDAMISASGTLMPLIGDAFDERA